MNWVAINVAAVVNIVLGALWFSPLLFQKPWVALRVDKTPMSGTASPMLYVITAVGALVAATTLDWIIGLTQPLFTIAEHPVSVRDLNLIVGGLFLIWKATTEIHEALEG